MPVSRPDKRVSNLMQQSIRNLVTAAIEVMLAESYELGFVAAIPNPPLRIRELKPPSLLIQACAIKIVCIAEQPVSFLMNRDKSLNV